MLAGLTLAYSSQDDTNSNSPIIQLKTTDITTRLRGLYRDLYRFIPLSLEMMPFV